MKVVKVIDSNSNVNRAGRFTSKPLRFFFEFSYDELVDSEIVCNEFHAKIRGKVTLTEAMKKIIDAITEHVPHDSLNVQYSLFAVQGK